MMGPRQQFSRMNLRFLSLNIYTQWRVISVSNLVLTCFVRLEPTRRVNANERDAGGWQRKNKKNAEKRSKKKKKKTRRRNNYLLEINRN